MQGNLSPSLIRTLVPFLFGGLLSNLGFQPDDPLAATVIMGIGGFVFYAVVRFLEVFAGPKWGYILGVAKAPGYKPGSPVKAAPVGEPSDAGRGTLGTIGAVLVVIAAVLLVLTLLEVIAVSVVTALIVLGVGGVLLLVDGQYPSRP